MMTDMNTPGAAGQGEGTPADQGDKGQPFDYEHAYSELRPEYTRATQELSQYRDRLTEYEDLFEALHDSDPEVQRAALDVLGLDMASEEGSPQGSEDFVDPLEQEVSSLRQQLDELRSAREQEAKESELAEMEEIRDEYIGDAISYIEENARQGAKFSENEEIALGNLAIAMTDENGVPDVQGAYNILYGNDGVLETNRQRWIDTKLAADQAPFGRTIPADQKPQTARERVAYIDERWARMQDQR